MEQQIAMNNSTYIKTAEEMVNLVEEVGFLPLFRNNIKGFSVEEHTIPEHWYTLDRQTDPWLWRVDAVLSKRVVYGKFFNKKAGFISKEWLPYFVNYRRDGYDFDSLYEDGRVKQRCKKIMDLYQTKKLISSIDLKKDAGFGKDGEKNFNGILTELQMQMYLTIQEFHRKKSKKGEEYGMYVGYYAEPEELWGYDYVTSCYCEKPEVSRERLENHVISRYPDVDVKELKKMLK